MTLFGLRGVCLCLCLCLCRPWAAPWSGGRTILLWSTLEGTACLPIEWNASALLRHMLPHQSILPPTAGVRDPAGCTQRTLRYDADDEVGVPTLAHTYNMPQLLHCHIMSPPSPDARKNEHQLNKEEPLLMG